MIAIFECIDTDDREIAIQKLTAAYPKIFLQKVGKTNQDDAHINPMIYVFYEKFFQFKKQFVNASEEFPATLSVFNIQETEEDERALIKRSYEIAHELKNKIWDHRLESQMIDQKLTELGYKWCPVENGEFSGEWRKVSEMKKQTMEEFLKEKEKQINSWSLENFLYEAQVFINGFHDVPQEDLENLYLIWGLYVARLNKEGYKINDDGVFVKMD